MKSDFDDRTLRSLRAPGTPYLVLLVPELADRLGQDAVRGTNPADSDAARLYLFDAIASFLKQTSSSRGVLAALFFICMALGGIIGDPLNGMLFGWAGTRRFLFLAMAVHTAAACVAVLRIPKGAGEAGTGG